MPEPKIIHVRDWDPASRSIYAGRAVPGKGIKASRWGNPFRIGDRHPALGYRMTREDSISAFGNWVRNSNDKRAVWMREHAEELLDAEYIACWCHPFDCHVRILLDLARETRARRLQGEQTIG